MNRCAINFLRILEREGPQIFNGQKLVVCWEHKRNSKMNSIKTTSQKVASELSG